MAVPVFANDGGSVTYTEGAGLGVLGTPAVVDANITVTDADDGNSITAATVSITGNFQTGDVLNFTNQGGITGVYNAGTGVLTLTGAANSATYTTALESRSPSPRRPTRPTPRRAR